MASGLIFQDGKVEIKKWYRVENGIIDEDIIPGDYSIQISDINGQTLVNIPFKSFFEMYTDPATGIETGATGFAFTIPYPEEASEIKIQYKDEVLTEFNPSIKLLHDAVYLIPDYGFVNNPEQRRKALHNKIDAAEKMINQGNFKGAVNNLKFDIKDKFEKWLIDDYQKEDILQLSKVEVIELIDEIIHRLSLIN